MDGITATHLFNVRTKKSSKVDGIDVERVTSEPFSTSEQNKYLVCEPAVTAECFCRTLFCYFSTKSTLVSYFCVNTYTSFEISLNVQKRLTKLVTKFC